MFKKKEKYGDIEKVTKNGNECQNMSSVATELKNPHGCIQPTVVTPPKTGRIKKQGKSVKHEFLQVFKLLGGIKGMLLWAEADNANKSAFYSMYSKLLPKAVDLDIDVDHAKRYDLPPEEQAELRDTAARIVQLRLVKGTVNEADNTTESIRKEEKTILSDV